MRLLMRLVGFAVFAAAMVFMQSFAQLFIQNSLQNSAHLWAQIPAQPAKVLSSGELQLALRKLNVLGSVLYVAAHPDDENTALIAYCAGEKLCRTTYLSLTRGDGGQNLIGSEQSELLGVIRTQELLAARRTDGGEQMFTRALDFGFSKGPEETLTIWGRERILADVVWAIRKQRPDVILTRFPKTGEGGHGHHTSSAILAEEAFAAAADPTRFPEQLRFVKPWRAKRLMWNAWLPILEARKADLAKLTSIDVGSYTPLLGKSYTELAAESRSMHKSQGFGSSGVRGESMNYFDYVAGDTIKPRVQSSQAAASGANSSAISVASFSASYDIFEGVDMTWNRVAGGAAVEKLITQALREFQPEAPAAIIPALLKARAALALVGDDYWRTQKRKELDEAIRSCAGMWIEAIAVGETAYSCVPGGSVRVAASLVNRSQTGSGASVQLWVKSVRFPFGKDTVLAGIANTSSQGTMQNAAQSAGQGVELQRGKFTKIEALVPLPATTPLTQPYWLMQPMEKGVFSIADQALIGQPENTPITASVVVSIRAGSGGEAAANSDIEFTVPVVHRRTDPVLGEVYRPLEVVPPVSLNLPDKSLVFVQGAPARMIAVLVKANKANARGRVSLALPAGWSATPASQAFSLANKGDELSVLFAVAPASSSLSSSPASTAASPDQFLRAEAVLDDGSVSNRGMTTIAYTHIPSQTLFPEARARLVALDLKSSVKSLAYLSTASDDVPDYLAQLGSQLGFTVKLLNDDDVDKLNLAEFDAVITGVRAYNTRPRLKQQYRKLMDYVQQGGTLLVQYNTANALVTDSIGPYPFAISRDRVTEEDAPVRLLNPKHPLLTAPNLISERDFAGWIQERGLYFANKWDARYQPLLGCNDAGEPDRQGGLLVAHYGKGAFIYTGYSWFRELPAGVAGAYRLFTNLVHAAKTLTASTDSKPDSKPDSKSDSKPSSPSSPSSKSPTKSKSTSSRTP
jgi:LmbE family N-acetylglucosaminyl deacetylase